MKKDIIKNSTTGMRVAPSPTEARFPGDSEHRRNHDAVMKLRRKRVMGRISDTLCVLAFLAAALTVGASIALQI